MSTSPLTPDSNNICAVVVAYYPDTLFEHRLQTLLSQVSMVVVVDNTPEPIALSTGLHAQWGAHLYSISNAENKGIAAALNQGLKFAAERGYPWLLTLDQDTRCYPDMVATLREAYAACRLPPAVLGSNYYDPSNKKCKVADMGAALWLAQKTVITSGCLMRVSVAGQIGGLREDYFIDQVDHEFCLRARAHGYSVAITRKPAIVHSVGLLGGVRLPWLGVLPNHSPVRKYYIARNTVVTLAQYWRREPSWCTRRLVMLILGLLEMSMLEVQRFEKTRAFAEGVWDGLLGRMGPCPKMRLTQRNQS